MDDVKEVKKRIPVKEGLFTMPSSPDEKPRLIASECPSCGEVLFPKRKICTNCQEEKLREITLSQRGKIYSFSVVMQRPGRYYEVRPLTHSVGLSFLKKSGLRVYSFAMTLMTSESAGMWRSSLKG